MIRRCLIQSVSLAMALAFADTVAGQAPRTDRHGDPLPPGAVARLGTSRFRLKEQISFAAFVADGKRVIAVADDGTYCVWEIPAGKEVLRFHARPSTEGAVESPLKGIGAAALAPDGKTIAVSFSQSPPAPAKGKAKARDSSPEILLHDVASGKRLGILNAAGADVNALLFAPDGRQLTAWCSDRYVRIWDWASGKLMGRAAPEGAPPGTPVGPVPVPFTGPPPTPATITLKNGAAVYAPDGKSFLVYGGSRAVQFFDAATGTEIGPGGHTVPLTSIAFSGDGATVITHDAKSMRAWDAATSKPGMVVAVPPPIGATTIVSPDGRFGLTVGRFETPGDAREAETRPATLYDTLSGKIIKEIGLDIEVTPTHRRPLTFSPDGKLLAVNAAGDTELIHLYSTATGKLLRTIAVPGLGTAAKGKGGFAKGKGKGPAAGPSFAAAATRLLFSPDSQTLAFQPNVLSAVSWFDVAGGKPLGTTSSTRDYLANLGGISPDGRCLVLQTIGGLTLVELATGKVRRSFGDKPPPLPVIDDTAENPLEELFRATPPAAKAKLNFALSHDGRLLALAKPEGAIAVVDVLTAKELAVLEGHSGPVNALAFAPDGKTLASAGADATALLWDLTRIERPAPARKGPLDLEASWHALASPDAGEAFAALIQLVAAPKETVALLKDRVRPVAPLDRKRVDQLIAQLSDPQFKVRELASVELLNLGEQVASLVDAALAGSPPPETLRRLQTIRGKLLLLQGERLRAYRAVEVLAHLGGAEARAVLEQLADGAPDSRITLSARQSLGRPNPK